MVGHAEGDGVVAVADGTHLFLRDVQAGIDVAGILLGERHRPKVAARSVGAFLCAHFRDHLLSQNESHHAAEVRLFQWG